MQTGQPNLKPVGVFVVVVFFFFFWLHRVLVAACGLFVVVRGLLSS